MADTTAAGIQATASLPLYRLDEPFSELLVSHGPNRWFSAPNLKPPCEP